MSKEKFKALTHFIISECDDNPGKLGAVRLNKSLWFTDMYSYWVNGVSVTGEKYVKRRKGPVPATVLATLEELKADEIIAVIEPQHQYDTRKYISLIAPDAGALSSSERELAREVVAFVCGKTANEISDMTHEEVWHAAEEGEEIPLYATLATGRGAITDEVKAWANSIISSKVA